MFKALGIVFIALTFTTLGWACLRPTADRRAIQWSDAIVHAKLQTIVDSEAEVYAFVVTDTIDGSLQPTQQILVHHVIPDASAPACGGHLTADDLGKSYRLLLRGHAGHPYILVNIAVDDPADTSGSDAFKQLVEETRKADASLTDDQMKTQALAYANAQDDTEADQAQETLEQMGIKAVPMIRQVMSVSNDVGKQRLAAVIKELIPQGEDNATTQPNK
jgi:hypothetical protein